jgi:MFS family permease
VVGRAAATRRPARGPIPRLRPGPRRAAFAAPARPRARSGFLPQRLGPLAHPQTPTKPQPAATPRRRRRRQVTSFWQFLVLRMLTGVAIGGVFPLIFSLLADLFPASQRAAMASLVQLAMGLGIGAGQVRAAAAAAA